MRVHIYMESFVRIFVHIAIYISVFPCAPSFSVETTSRGAIEPDRT